MFFKIINHAATILVYPSAKIKNYLLTKLDLNITLLFSVLFEWEKTK